MLESRSIIVSLGEKVRVSRDFKACVIAVGSHKGCGDQGGLMDKVVLVFMRFGGGVENLRVGFIIDKLGIAIKDLGSGLGGCLLLRGVGLCLWRILRAL